MNPWSLSGEAERTFQKPDFGAYKLRDHGPETLFFWACFGQSPWVGPVAVPTFRNCRENQVRKCGVCPAHWGCPVPRASLSFTCWRCVFMAGSGQLGLLLFCWKKLSDAIEISEPIRSGETKHLVEKGNHKKNSILFLKIFILNFNL